MVYSPVNPWVFPFNPSYPLIPQLNFITSISQSKNAVITTLTNHGWYSGLFVRIVFPQSFAPAFGMPQINGQIGEIVVLSPTAVAIDIDTSGYDPFIYVASSQSPQIVPIGVLAESTNNDSVQVNPPNNSPRPVIFQPTAPRASGPVNVP